MALIALAVLPGTGREPMLRLAKQQDADGFYPVLLEDGEEVGRFQLFDEPLLDAMNDSIQTLRSPGSLASLIEAAGAVCLERCGAILDTRLPPDEEAAGEGVAG